MSRVRFLAVLVATALALWCIWNLLLTTFVDNGWRVPFGWWLGFLAARLAMLVLMHDVPTGDDDTRVGTP